MRSENIVLLTFALSILTGCSTPRHSATRDRSNSPPLYLYWGTEAYGSASRFLSGQIHLAQEISVGGDDFLALNGHIERHGDSLTADLLGSTGGQSQFYRGAMTPEKPYFAQGGAASGGAGPPFWFLVSTNSNCRAVLERVNAEAGLTNTPFDHASGMLPQPVYPVSDAPDSIFRIVVKPAKTRFRAGISLAFRVENLTTTNQYLHMSSQSWEELWTTSNPNVSLVIPDASANVPITVKIPPGGAYADELFAGITNPFHKYRDISFQLGFTPREIGKTFWSNLVTVTAP